MSVIYSEEHYIIMQKNYIIHTLNQFLTIYLTYEKIFLLEKQCTDSFIVSDKNFHLLK